jgi:hypothetical protein
MVRYFKDLWHRTRLSTRSVPPQLERIACSFEARRAWKLRAGNAASLQALRALRANGTLARATFHVT